MLIRAFNIAYVKWHDIFNEETLNQNTKYMKALGIILVVVGILMLIFTNISFTKEKKVVDLGPVEVNKKEKKTIDWPSYAGGIAVISGIVVLVASRKK